MIPGAVSAMVGSPQSILMGGILTVLSTISGPALAGQTCRADPLALKSSPQIVQAANGLRLDMTHLRFQACDQQSFRTGMINGTITISYPAEITSLQRGLGAITHELGHAYQLRQAGSLAALRQQLGGSSERIELGADFLAGYLFRNYVSGANRADFQTSIALVGAFDDLSGVRYGTPEDRNAAFRLGYYYSGAPDNVDAANRYFHRDGFGSIQAQTR